MANINYWFGYWLAANEANALAPGEVHELPGFAVSWQFTPP